MFAAYFDPCHQCKLHWPKTPAIVWPTLASMMMETFFFKRQKATMTKIAQKQHLLIVDYELFVCHVDLCSKEWLGKSPNTPEKLAIKPLAEQMHGILFLQPLARIGRGSFGYRALVLGAYIALSVLCNPELKRMHYWLFFVALTSSIQKTYQYIIIITILSCSKSTPWNASVWIHRPCWTLE